MTNDKKEFFGTQVIWILLFGILGVGGNVAVDTIFPLLMGD
jgi:hypothetical protein